jgi:Ca-activated chloride channel family protein
MIHLYNVLLAFALILFVICNTSLAQLKNDLPSPRPVSITVTVMNQRKEIVSGLPQNAFTISDDSGEREITSVSSEDAPMSIAILIDLSGSIKSDSNRKRIESILDALSQFVQKSHPSNEYFIIGFNATPYLLLDGARDANATLSTLQKLASEKLGGNTALYDACLAGIEKVTRGVYPKQVILLISDGRDNSSQYKLNDVRRLLKEKSVLVYSLNITMGWDGSRIDHFNTEGSQVLEELASLTGGVMYSPSNAAETKTKLERIALELRQQYLIGFLPAKETSSGKWHPLKIKVSLPADSLQGVQKGSARSRKGYYPTLTSK